MSDKKQSGNWYVFNKGITLHKTGSESGRIISDVEHSIGARVTIEENADSAPYAVTFGIYGVLFHTHFTGLESEARQYATEAKKRIELLLEHLLIPETEQDDLWQREYEKQVDMICR